MLIREEYVDVIKLNPYIDKKFLFKKDDKNNNVLIEQLKNNNYELVIDLQNNLRSKKVVSSLKTNNVKLDKRSFDKFLLVNFKVNKLKEAPQIPVRYSNTIQKIKLDEQGLNLFTDKSANAELIGKNNLIGFCPGARHFTKRWPKDIQNITVGKSTKPKTAKTKIKLLGLCQVSGGNTPAANNKSFGFFKVEKNSWRGRID